MLPTLLLDLWPCVLLLVSFVAFVWHNGGVVLGDKSNHVAQLHSVQVLYLWPFILFFSWPVILPNLLAISSSWRRLRHTLPRFSVLVVTTTVMLVAVHTNTIVHPFTLADNRHYTFYVFRILTSRPWIKYAAVPVYLFSAWAVVLALGAATAPTRKQETMYRDIVPSSFLLVWLATTTLNLVTAPLVEPRYFIIPWLIWRLHVPEPVLVPEPEPEPEKHVSAPALASASTSKSQSWWLGTRTPQLVEANNLVLELAWNVVVNSVTIHIFLTWGFEWKQDPGVTQRFMW